jgi:hypothetical protein
LRAAQLSKIDEGGAGGHTGGGHLNLWVPDALGDFFFGVCI